MRLKEKRKKKEGGLTYAAVTLLVIALPIMVVVMCHRCVGGGATPAANFALPVVVVPAVGVAAVEVERINEQK